MDKHIRLILASSSPYRKAQLESLGIPFECISPSIDESAFAFETPYALAQRLALEKSAHIAKQHPDAVVIGADQVLDLDGMALGKPGNHENAVHQLEILSGKTAIFHSAVALISPHHQQVAISSTRARFRTLSRQQIETYLCKDKPYDTAGSAKAESLGIALLEELSNHDPSAIIGLPLITLTRMLCNIGIDPLSWMPTSEAER